MWHNPFTNYIHGTLGSSSSSLFMHMPQETNQDRVKMASNQKKKDSIQWDMLKEIESYSFRDRARFINPYHFEKLENE